MEQKERKRISISPLGLNLSTPDNVVEDGALEVCHNLRFANGAWRNVQEFDKKDIPESLADKNILYIHPVQGVYNYISQDEVEVKKSKIKYYGTTAYRLANLLRIDYFTNKPLLGTTNNPNGISLYEKSVTSPYIIGQVVNYDNGVLTYAPKDITPDDGYITLYYSDVFYRKQNNSYSERFYFTSEDIGTSKAVFIKKGDNYIFFGEVTKVAGVIATVKEKESGDSFTVRIDAIATESVYLPRRVEGRNNYFVEYERFALYAISDRIGYVQDVSDVDPNSNLPTSTPKFIGDADFPTYLYLDDEGNEKEFHRESNEYGNNNATVNTLYLERYKAEVPEEQQIWGVRHNVCYTYYEDGEEFGLCTTVYSWLMMDNDPLPTISNFYADSSKDIVETMTSSATQLTAYNEAGEQIYVFPDTTSNYLFDHFGNMLICRDADRQTTNYFIFGENTYKPYGNEGKTSLSFSVSVKDTIHSPDMADVPMFYKAAGFSAEDGSLDGRLFLGAGEIALPLNKAYPEILDAASNLRLRNEHNGYFRGELAMFVVARAKDGTEIYRTPPQVFRSETLLGVEADVMLYSMRDTQETEGATIYYEEADQYFPYVYLVWQRKLFDKAMGVDKSNPSYKKWDTWIHKHKRYSKFVQPFLDSVKAADLYKLDVDIKAEGNNIHEVAIYTTRLYPLFVFERGSIKVNPVEILNEPFYEMTVLTDGELKYTITYEDLHNIEANSDKIYKLSQSGEDTFFAHNGVEYNNVYHSFDIEILKPKVGNISLTGVSGDNLPSLECMTTSRLYDDSVTFATYTAAEVFGNENNLFSQTQPTLISFPEALREVAFGYPNGNNIVALGKFSPEYSTTLNVSYITGIIEESLNTDDTGIMQPNGYWTKTSYSTFVNKMQKASRTFKKYAPINLCNLDVNEDVTCIPSYPIQVSNRIQASDYGNPLTNPYNRSYRVGTTNNKIVAINSAAIKMSDTKFGEFPLYVFTTEGIYALQTGSDTLYSNVIPISKHIAINPNTLAVEGAVLFFTDKGLHSLTAKGVQLISAGLHEDNNRIPEWMHTCRMVYLPEFNEAMCVLVNDDGTTTGKAYILSLDNMCWSEREIPQGIWTNTEEVMIGQTLYDLDNESNVIKKVITMETRPIKLGANKELKRLETLVVRFEADEDEELEVTIKGSIDGVEYKDLRKVSATTNTDVLIRRTPASVKYLKFVVKSSNLQSSIRLIRFDTEHYLRFVRKMR